MKKYMICALVPLMALTACTGQGSNEGDESENVVVSFRQETPEDAALDKKWEALIADFEAQNPKIDIQRSTLGLEEQRQLTRTELSSGTGPDIFTYSTGPAFAGLLADAGLILDLSGAYEELNWEVYDWTKGSVTDSDGNLYGFPDEVGTLGVFYNKTLFSDLGLEEPQTVQELRRAAEKAKDAGKIPFAFGNSQQWPAGHLFSMSASNALTCEGISNVLYGDGSWDTSEVSEAIDLVFRDFEEAGYYPPSTNAITYDDANNLFYGGQAAMLPSGSWLVGGMNERDLGFEVGFFPFPAFGEKPIAPPTTLGRGFFVRHDIPDVKREAALQFLDYLADPATAQSIAETFNYIPGVPFDFQSADVSPVFREVLESIPQPAEGEDRGQNIDVVAPQIFNEVMFTGFQEVLNGTRTPEQQAAALQAAWEEAVEAGDVTKSKTAGACTGS